MEPKKVCPVCKMGQHQWKGNGGRGVNVGGKTYCCEGCANGVGCMCEVLEEQEITAAGETEQVTKKKKPVDEIGFAAEGSPD